MKSYYARLGLTGPPPATEQGLFDLHRAQAFSIPFDNLTVLLGEVPSLEKADLLAKVASGQRGGYCFELNSLFQHALGHAGFAFTPYLARVQVHNPLPGPLTHYVCVVTVHGRDFLCDVGFGGPGIRYPMPLEEGREETQDGETFRLRHDADFGFCLEQRGPDRWVPAYHFHRSRILPIDVIMGNHFCATFPNSIFQRWLMLARPFAGGKHVVLGRRHWHHEGGNVTERKLGSFDELLSLLKPAFGVELGGDRLARLREMFPRMPEA